MLDPFILTFQSDHAWDVNSAPHEILSKQWNITDPVDGHQLFLLMIRSDLEYDSVLGHKIHTDSMKNAYHNMLSGSSNGDYLPEDFKNRLSDERYVGQNDDVVTLLAQQVMLLDRGSDKTIVIINNHSSWITDLWGDDPTLSMTNMHKEQWLFRHTFFKDFNIISITEDLTRMSDNPLLYPNQLFEGISTDINTLDKLVDFIKDTIPSKDYHVYTSCRYGFTGSIVGGKLNAKTVFMNHSITSTMSAPSLSLNDFTTITSNNHIIELDCMDYGSFYFWTDLWDNIFEPGIKYGVQDLGDVCDKYPNTYYNYAYITDHIVLSLITPWTDIAINTTRDNLCISPLESDGPHESAKVQRKQFMRSIDNSYKSI
tara:strand:+ start:122 stop:1231 length:1110 start_codon:yes stop_codon:yes gene_type:complete